MVTEWLHLGFVHRNPNPPNSATLPADELPFKYVSVRASPATDKTG
jgi:hypothetical protein